MDETTPGAAVPGTVVATSCAFRQYPLNIRRTGAAVCGKIAVVVVWEAVGHCVAAAGVPTKDAAAVEGVDGNCVAAAGVPAKGIVVVDGRVGHCEAAAGVSSKGVAPVDAAVGNCVAAAGVPGKEVVVLDPATPGVAVTFDAASGGVVAPGRRVVAEAEGKKVPGLAVALGKLGGIVSYGIKGEEAFPVAGGPVTGVTVAGIIVAGVTVAAPPGIEVAPGIEVKGKGVTSEEETLLEGADSSGVVGGFDCPLKAATKRAATVRTNCW